MRRSTCWRGHARLPGRGGRGWSVSSAVGTTGSCGSMEGWRAAIRRGGGCSGCEREWRGARGAGVEGLVGGWHDRFRRGYGGLASRDPEGWRLLGLRAGMEGRAGGGEAAPGFGEVRPWRTGALALDDGAELAVGFEATASLGERVGLLVQPEVASAEVRLRRADLTTRFGNVNLAVGRQPLRSAGSAQTGLVLSGAAALDRFEVGSARPFTLPGPLRLLGPLSADLFVSRFW